MNFINKNKTLKLNALKISKIERGLHIIKFMVKFYTKNPEFWYKVYQISPNIQFYKNKTKSGYISGCTEPGEHSKCTKSTLGTN